jgi:predicted MFS family arabinose efflux permease
MAISYTEIGTLIGLYSLPGIVIAFPGGLLGKRFGDKRVCAGALALMVLGGVLLGGSHTYALAFAGRLLSGIGAVLLNVMLTKMVTDWFAGKEIVTAMGIILSSWPCGIALALVSQSAMASAYSWRAVMVLTAALCTLALGLVFMYYRRPPSPVEAVEGGPVRFRVPRRELLPVSMAGLAWSAFNVGLIIFFSFTPTVLITRGLSTVEAGSLVSLGMWVSMFSVPLGGYLTERIGWPQATIVLFSLLTGGTLCLLPYLPMPLAVCVLVGLGIGPPAGAIMALPSQVLSPEHRSPGLAIFHSWSYAGRAVGPALAGLGRDLTGSPATPLLVGGGMFLATACFLVMFRLCQTLGTDQAHALRLQEEASVRRQPGG